MLGNYLLFDNEVFPNPKTPSRNSKTIENVSQSEAGTDLVVVVRPAEALTHEESTTMVYQNKTYNVRVRDFVEKTVEGSEWLTSVNGLFECSVNVTEY